jgi:GTP-binding protein HflX
MAKDQGSSIFISAKERENVEEFKKLIYDEVKKIHVTRFPYNDFLYDYYPEGG